MARKKVSRRKPKLDPVPDLDPRRALEAFLRGISEETHAALPDDMLDVIDNAAVDLLTDDPTLAAEKPRMFARLVRRRVNEHRREVRQKHGREYAHKVGWEPDPERCAQFMELLLKYLPLFIDMFSESNPAVARVLAMAA